MCESYIFGENVSLANKGAPRSKVWRELVSQTSAPVFLGNSCWNSLFLSRGPLETAQTKDLLPHNQFNMISSKLKVTSSSSRFVPTASCNVTLNGCCLSDIKLNTITVPFLTTRCWEISHAEPLKQASRLTWSLFRTGYMRREWFFKKKKSSLLHHVGRCGKTVSMTRTHSLYTFRKLLSIKHMNEWFLHGGCSV